MSTQEILALLMPIILIGFGWALNEFADFFKSRKSDQRKLNKILFTLLEIRRAFIKLSTFDNHFNKIMEKLVKVNDRNGLQYDQDVFEIREILKKQLPGLEVIDPLVDKIKHDLEVISEFDPILAFELSINYNIKQRIDGFNNYIDEVAHSINPEDSKKIKSLFQPTFINDAISDLDIYITKFTAGLPTKTQKKVAQLLKESHELNDEELNGSLNNFVKTINNVLPEQEKLILR